MTRTTRVFQLVLLLIAGVLSAGALAGCGGSDTGGRIRTLIQNITIPRRTVTTGGTTQTLQQTVTSTTVTTPASPATSSSGLPLWAWIAIAVAAACLVVLLVWLISRPRKLKPEEYQGGTTAVSNLGMYGIKDFTAVINPPHATILAVGASEERPVVRNGKIEIAHIMSVTLSCDHRAVDGALGAELIGEFKRLIENPVMMMV